MTHSSASQRPTSNETTKEEHNERSHFVTSPLPGVRRCLAEAAKAGMSCDSHDGRRDEAEPLASIVVGDRAKLRLSLMRCIDAGDEFGNDAGEGMPSQNAGVPPPRVSLADLTFSPAVAKIMEGYKPPTESPSPSLAQEGSARPHSPTIVALAPAPISTTPSHLESTDAESAGEALSLAGAGGGGGGGGGETVVTAPAQDTADAIPLYWYYKATGVSFGRGGSLAPPESDASSSSPADSPKAVVGSCLTSWFLSDGAPNFAASTSSLKRKREMDEDSVLRYTLQELVQGQVRTSDNGSSHLPTSDAASASTATALQGIAQLLQEERKKAEKLEHAIDRVLL